MNDWLQKKKQSLWPDKRNFCQISLKKHRKLILLVNSKFIHSKLDFRKTKPSTCSAYCSVNCHRARKKWNIVLFASISMCVIFFNKRTNSENLFHIGTMMLLISRNPLHIGKIDSPEKNQYLVTFQWQTNTYKICIDASVQFKCRNQHENGGSSLSSESKILSP